MNKVIKKLSMLTLAVVVVIGAAAGFAAFEAHVINVTAHIENALAVDPEHIDFGVVFPQEYVEKQFTVGLSESFLDSENQKRVKDVCYKIVQKPKPLPNDEFGEDDVLNPWYTFVNPTPADGSDYSIASGVLTITAAPGDDLFGLPNVPPGHNYTAPRMLTGVVTGDFTIETKVTANPGENYEGAGLLVYQSDGNLVRLELVDYDGSGISSIYMENQKDKVKIGEGWTHHVGLTTAYLRITRTGDTFAGSYSSDGVTWQNVLLDHGTMDNDALTDPQAGVAVVSNGNTNGMFSADFDYFKGGVYKDLCRFLSKLPKDGECGDYGVPSYYVTKDEHGIPVDPYCKEPMPHVAEGDLYIEGDIIDGWTVDLKVPPVDGYVGQDWPDSCKDYTVPHDSLTYGCDLWIEVTELSYWQCSDMTDNDPDGLIDDHDYQCHEDGDLNNPYCPDWDDESTNCPIGWTTP